MSIDYRQATKADLYFLDELHTACMKDKVALVYQWQPQLFRQTFNPQITQIILIDDTKVGFLQFWRQKNELYLGNLMVAPQFQNRGIGTKVMQKILNYGREQRMPIRLQVLIKNRAKKFYRRHGFSVIRKTKTHYIMMTQSF